MVNRMKNFLLSRGEYGKHSSVLLLMFLLLSLFYPQHGNAQSRTVSGTVTSMLDGSPLPGVNVLVQGTTSGTITDVNGNYSISANDSDVLVFSYVGYTTEEVAVSGIQGSTLNITLAEDIESLSEVVVVGYGTQRKSDLTGSVVSIAPEEVNNMATQDINQNLQGRVPGLQIIANSGNPAEGTTVRIRGVGTINNSDPLYVVDGFQTGDISWLTPSDIKSIEVLKDASATAIYGSRGANGVILISTKDGTEGKKRFNLDFNAYGGIQEASNTVDVMNAHEYIGYRAQAHLNQLRSADPSGTYNIYDGIRAFSGADSAIARHVYDNKLVGTDWQDVVLRKAPVQVYTLSLSGATEDHNYVLSGSYQDNQGILRNSYLEKVTLRFKNDYSIADWVTVGTSFNFLRDEFTRTDNDGFGGLLPSAIRVSPLAPVWDNNTDNYGNPTLTDVRQNPQQRVDELEMDVQTRHKYVFGGYLQFDITKDLNFRSQGYYDYDQRQIKQYLPEFYVNQLVNRTRSQLTEGFETRKSWIVSNYFNYSKDFDVHGINAMVGIEMQNNHTEINSITAYEVPQAEALRYLNQQRSGELTPATTVEDVALLSYFGRVNYNYDSRYVLTATLRYDGSSRFAEGNRWGLFPSFAAAWNVDREAFMQDNIFSTLKLRASWGQVGNESSARAHGTVTYAQPLQNYSFGGVVVNGKSPRELGNPDLIWETSESLNIGADLGVFNDKLSLALDYFERTTKDMIVAAPAPIYAGALPPRENAGSIENKGFEFAINYRNAESAIKYEIGYNMSFTRNKVLSLGAGEFLDGDNFPHIGRLTRTQVGHPVSSFYGIQTNGIFKTQEELEAHYWQPNAQLGDVKFVNQDGDSTITMAGDAVFLGDPFPDFLFGFTARLEYGGFDFSLMINGSQGNEVVNNLARYINNSGDWADNQLASRLDYYDPVTNPNSNEPRVISGDPNGNGGTFSDRYVEDASFIRLRNVQLGYTLPQNLMDVIGIGSVRVYIAADNLFTITDYSGFDPEIGEFFGNPLNYGVAGANYPKARTFFAGINIKL